MKKETGVTSRIGHNLTTITLIRRDIGAVQPLKIAGNCIIPTVRFSEWYEDYAMTTLLAALTIREAEILQQVAHGRRNYEIAHMMGITTRSVERHLSHIFANCK